MKNFIFTALLLVGATVLMSYNTVYNELELIPIEEVVSSEKENLNFDCWWDETFKGNFNAKRDAACGSRTSLKIWYTNPYSYPVRVAFYLRDTNGNLNSTSPYVINVKPGKTVYHHKCESNGRYSILAARSGTDCYFPKLN